ncbi:MAG: hypothetical protein ACM3X6_13165 [Patescibacteria group bacterium]
MLYRFRRFLLVPLLLSIFPALIGCGMLRGPGGSGSLPSPVRARRVSPEILAFFPQEQGTRWRYTGFAEYAHDMELRSISRGRRTVVHHIRGQVEDVSGGESTKNSRFRLDLVFTAKEVTERILEADTPFPHRLDGLILLRLPLKPKTTWRQRVRAKGRSVTATAEILGLEMDGKGSRPQAVTVRYRAPMAGMPGGVYEEIRVFRRGTGVATFQNTFGANEGEIFNYTLYSLQKGRGGADR